MKIITHAEFEGERPLFASHNVRLENVTIHEGESALKESNHIEVSHCCLEGKYPFWHVNGLSVEDSIFEETSRAPLWYSKNVEVKNSTLHSPKSFREIKGLQLKEVELTNAIEAFWNCKEISMENVSIKRAEYAFLNSKDIKLKNYTHEGKYAFQYVKDVEIHNSILQTKDAFWESENVTIYDSVIHGEYLAWYSKNLKLVRCTISGTQPLCYAQNLILEDCHMEEDCDLCFEYSGVNARIKGNIHSVKNPLSGYIEADKIGEIIEDEHKRGEQCIYKTLS
ncbi:MAG TPA: DUF3737 domain-containing protein [Porphyromonadaceae bacterium]|nr:DUF3737 domain-containing protein [Porphyromonadaceae bacterium]